MYLFKIKQREIPFLCSREFILRTSSHWLFHMYCLLFKVKQHWWYRAVISFLLYFGLPTICVVRKRVYSHTHDQCLFIQGYINVIYWEINLQIRPQFVVNANRNTNPWPINYCCESICLQEAKIRLFQIKCKFERVWSGNEKCVSIRWVSRKVLNLVWIAVSIVPYIFDTLLLSKNGI